MKPFITLTVLTIQASLADAQPFILSPEKSTIRSAAVSEASGIAVSPSNPDFFWLINDSGAGPEIHLAGTDGSDRGKITLKDTKNIDWEDLASFRLDGKSYLLVADTGDNNAKRDDCVFYIVREPDLPAEGKSRDLTLMPSWKVPFRYEGGPRDCESASVDAVAEKIVFISKRTKPPEVYELPLRAAEKRGIQVAKPLGTTEVKPPASNILPYMDQPTSLDLSADRSMAAVVTYHGVFLFPRTPKESWVEAFAKKPVELGPHHLGQAESVAFSRDGKTIYVTAEGRKPPVVRFQKSAAN